MAKRKRTWGRWENTGKQPKEGGQGRVFIVDDSQSDGTVLAALKELKNPKRINRFRREVDAFIALGEHPHLIKVYDSALGEDNDKKYYVMEIADNSLEDVAQQVAEDTTLTLKVFDGICEGAAYIHDSDILHRDIKPANVLMIDGVPKLSDLGLCLVATEERLTSTDEAVGPRLFMAPELEDGRNLDVDARADVYSLGKLLYYLLTGGDVFAREKRCFGKESISSRFRDPRYKPFDSLLRRCITEAPRERFSDAGELLDAYRKACEAYSKHPRTTIILKLPDPLMAFQQENTTPLQNLTTSELKEALLLATNAGIEPSQTVVKWFSERPSEGIVKELLALICPLLEKLPTDLVNQFACNVMQHGDAWGTSWGTECTDTQRESLVYTAITVGEDTEVLRTAAHKQFPGSHMQSVLPEILKRFDKLGEDDQRAFVALTMQMNWEGKCEWLVSNLDAFRQDEILLEGALTSLFQFGDESIQQELVRLGPLMKTDEEIGAYGRAFTAHANPDVVSQLGQSQKLDPKMQICVAIKKDVDSGGTSNMDALRQKYLDGEPEG